MSEEKEKEQEQASDDSLSPLWQSERRVFQAEREREKYRAVACFLYGILLGLLAARGLFYD